jgi:hypothetical protein
MSSSSGPSPAELENLGIIFVGFVATTILYGLTFSRAFNFTRTVSILKPILQCTETYIFYLHFPRDHRWMKYLVSGSFSLSLLQSH